MSGAAGPGGARGDVLARIRRALADVPAGEAPLPAAPAGAALGGAGAPADAPAGAVAAPPSSVTERFAERVADYRATVLRCGAGDAEVAAALRGVCGERGLRRLAVPHDLPAGWRPEGVGLVEDSGDAPLSVEELDAVPGVLTGARLGIAETGTLVLDHGPGQGRRALTLVPDLHLCVVRARTVVADVPDALRALGTPGRCTFVSGPSATSDIELQRVEGVHGPRTLIVLLAG